MNIDTPQHVISMFRLNRSMKLAQMIAEVPDAETLPVFRSKIRSGLVMPTVKSMAGRKSQHATLNSSLTEGWHGTGAEQNAVKGRL